ncbi:MAG: DUF3021 family protein [Ruminococcus sp.]|nr:DUF3021 family protein [Ruminococcus sp.]
MKYISEFVKYFCYITTGIVIVSGITVLSNEMIPSATVLQSVLAGAITALVTTFFLTGEPKSKKDMFLRLTFHYISLCVIMVIIGFSFNWIPHSIMGVIFMIAAVGVVYIFTALSYMFTSQKEIKELNKALNEKYHNGTSETD